MGQQNKFETLSGFAAGLNQALTERWKKPLSISRELKRLDGRNESYIRLQTAGAEEVVDIFEYYYQHKLQRQVEPGDVLEWLATTARRVRILYQTGSVQPRRDRELASSQSPGARRSTTWQPPVEYLIGEIWYAKLLAPLVSLVGLMMPLLRGFSSVHPAFSFLSAIVVRPAYALLDPLLRDFAGDVTAYTAYNVKEKLNQVRAEILDGCAKSIQNLLEDRTPDGSTTYDRVVVAGHSLGSVVAYDSISQINSDLITGGWSPSTGDPRRLDGLITFGSPLDKIALLFWPLNEEQRARMHPSRGRFLSWLSRFARRRSGSEKPAWQAAKSRWTEEQIRLQSAMVQHYHRIRGLWINLGDGLKPLTDHIQNPLDHIAWLNFYHKRDLIAGHLDAYCGVENIEVHPADTPHEPAFPAAHSYYWYDRNMFHNISERFLEVKRVTDERRLEQQMGAADPPWAA